VKKLLDSLDYPLNGSQDSIKASEIIDRVYFDENHRPILGALCACGNYYHLNTLTNKIDALLEQEYGVKGKETYVVAGTPHFSPVSSGLQVGFRNERLDLLEKSVTWLKNVGGEFNLNMYRVVKGYYRRPEVASEMRTLVSNVKKQCLESQTCNNWLIQGKSGSGKTCLFESIANDLGDDVEFVHIKLDGKHMNKATWEKSLADVVRKAKEKPVLCLLDEMNKHRDENWPLL
jgi:ABC-type glutathione transport system ATPase component